MRPEAFSLNGIPALCWGRPCRRGFLYLHGQGGSKAEAAAFAAAAAEAGWQTVSVDLPGHGDRTAEAAELVPWRVVPELRCALAELRGRWEQTALFGTSLGAWFGLLAYPDAPLAGALLLSPVVDMEALIRKMMGWAGVTEEQLAREGTHPHGLRTDPLLGVSAVCPDPSAPALAGAHGDPVRRPGPSDGPGDHRGLRRAGTAAA